MEINFFWRGGTMPKLQQACLHSWKTKGHTPVLWSYQNISFDFVEARDAREIMPENEREHPALFADGFRYKLLLERGGYWSDCDIVCWNPDFVFSKTTFATELAKNGADWITNCFMYSTPGCPVMAEILESYLKVPRPLTWGQTGPLLVTRAMERHNDKADLLENERFCPVPWWEKRNLGKKHLENPLDFTGSFGIHLWNELWQRECGYASVNPASFIGKFITQYQTK